MDHPFFGNYRRRALFAGIVVLVTILQTIIVASTSLIFKYAWIDSLVFNLIFAACILPLWFPVYYIRWKDKSWYFNLITHLALLLFVSLVWLGSGYLLMNLFFQDNEIYITYLYSSLIWKFIEGIFFYIIVVLIYFLFLLNKQLEEKEKKEAKLSKLITINKLERVAVKDRQQIHVIPVPEIQFIEACGDYVSLFTASGSFLKEKTMKYFEENLPAQQFVRIHRSTIVNVNEVAKIELYEKESYRVYLKNGQILKASAAGYKALKEMVHW
jgi:hypothetical protein